MAVNVDVVLGGEWSAPRENVGNKAKTMLNNIITKFSSLNNELMLSIVVGV